ncbi:hypothetical protein [Glaciimonas soli]|uniref:Uncharacterized protein n=1 Tax=Glaciimonas soli TaxID=2590999 RepID=A0A843YYM8_9BURK|nr:hypothetical protein [Glaciimonas soli]MQR02578.1 hypothetical protein [Glaciimonas soli]
MSDATMKLEAVYYGSAIPANKASLTFLAVVFDRIHFPDVYLPVDGFDSKDVLKEANRIEAYGFTDYDTTLLVGALRCLPMMNDLKQFCHFTGSNTFDAKFGPETVQLVDALELEVFGPRPENFIPTYQTIHSKGLPDNNDCIVYPGALFYPANAIVYATQNGLPLVNDNMHLPVPAFGGNDAVHNTKLLATIMAMECVKFALPNVRALTPKEIIELRAELSKYLAQFRRSLLGLAATLNSQISKSDSYEDIMKAATFIVQTEVEPSLAELRDALEGTEQDWYKRTFDLAKEAPLLATMYATMPRAAVIAKVLIMLGGVFVDSRAGAASQKNASRSGMYYLLRAQDAMRKGP